MSMLALDTNAYRALEDGNRKLAIEVRKTTVIGMPIVVLGELYFGFEKGIRKQVNHSNLERFLSTSRVEILHIDEHTARGFGEIAAELSAIGKPIQQDDIWIASLCKQYGYVLASADAGFKHITGLDIFSF